MKWDREELARFIGTTGIAMLIAGYLRYSIQGELLTFSKVVLVLGALLLLASIVIGFGGILSFFSKRSSQQGTNTTVLSVAVIAILVIVNFVGFRHHKRFDLTTEKLYTLSDQTKQIVGGLQKDVTIVHFDKSANPALDDQMAEYTSLSRHLKFQNVDPQQKPEIAEQYGATRTGDVILASGPRKEHLESGGVPSEEDITAAIIKVTQDKVKTVCFVTGHGEKSLADDGENGYSHLDAGLKKENYATKTINLVSENGVTPDCSVVVIAGPTQGYFPQEAELLNKYLTGTGKGLILVDPQTDPKLGEIFQAWNTNVGDNVVIDASGVGRLFGAGPAIPLVTTFGDSPITKNFAGSMTFFPLARTVSVADKSKTDPQAVEFLKTSPRSFTVANLKQGRNEVIYDPKTSTLGPLSLGVAASRKSGAGEVRVVVIGNSTFAANPYLGQQKNGDLFYNTINWLAQDENLISIRPKSQTNRRVTLTEGQASALRWLDLFILPGIVIFSGVYIWWKRR
jgi:gliding motility-associatede transport system auxiliary component